MSSYQLPSVDANLDPSREVAGSVWESDPGFVFVGEAGVVGDRSCVLSLPRMVVGFGAVLVAS